MSTKYPVFKAAAVRATPVILDRDATIEKSCKFIKEAADNGAKLVAFPEGYIPGYPAWFYTPTSLILDHGITDCIKTP